MAPKKFLRDLPLTLSSGIAPIPRKFKIPPLDGSLALPEIYDWHFAENPNKTLFMYESEPAGYTHITYREVVPASHRASQWIASAISVDLDEVTDETPPVAIIATSDTITHFCVQLGLLKAGISYICITPRTSPAVVAHLAEKVGVNFAFHSSEPAVVALVQEASELMKQTYSRSLRYSPMPEFRDIFTDGAYPILKKRKYNMDFVATYSHSSGSSGSFPKPIPWTHAFILQVSMAPLFGDVDVCEEVFACHSVSMTHGTGQHFLAWIVSSGIVMAVFKPSIPAKFPTPEATYQALAKLGPDYIWVFANFLENWSADLEKVEVLKKAKRSIFVGSMLKKDVGDYLARCGVQIYPLYGMAEAGVLGSFLPPPQGLEWEYFPLTAHSGGHFVDQGDNLYELILVEDQYKRIGVSNSTFEGARAYETRDSFIRHPSKPGYWKACGRLDDRLVHPNGEKTNPVPMEHIIDMDPRVKSAIVFGNGRNRCGVLIQLEESFLFDPVDSDLLSTFRQYILPKVEAANKVAPSYSRIYPEMVMVSSPSKPFTYTEKGTLRRKEILKAYASEIDTLYSELDEGVGIEISFPADATYDNIVTFVQAVLHTIPLNVPEDEDVFRYGCTSLQATRIEIIIRSSLRKVLEDSAVKSLRNFVYEYQTPQAIAEYLSLALKEAKSTSAASHMGEMKKLLASLVTDFPIFRGISEHASAEISSDHVVILVTGTTGALGSNVLAEVLNDDSVSRIYALNRRHESVVLRERQRQAFFEQGLTGEQLDHRKLELLEGDLTQAHFGLDPGTFEEVSSPLLLENFLLTIQQYDRCNKGSRISIT
ncbi:hypothetical protein V5O48_015232 [Marasmius crinis-equi]|uniref:Acetyl-CoA synthetase-like protein n=1 Tax=Marasmius crinis-equi TaxID=585013 RepID=A0ABR3EV43_9AGAR